MSLYIKVQNGKTIDHPVFWDNLLQVFGRIPDEYQPFERIAQPSLSMYEEWDTDAEQYAFIDGVWTDVWPKKPITGERLEALQQELRNNLKIGLANTRDWALRSMAEALDDAKPLWLEYIQKLDNFEIPETGDTSHLVLPPAPLMIRRDENGKIVSVNNSGSTPNVIG